MRFGFALLAIAPFAERLGFVTEQLAMHTNDTRTIQRPAAVAHEHNTREANVLHLLHRCQTQQTRPDVVQKVGSRVVMMS